MNDKRRKEVQAVLDQLLELKASVENLLEEERNAYDNMPEGLQQATVGQASEAAAAALEAAFDAIDDVESSLQEAMV